MAVLIGRLWQLQVIRGDDYYEKARSNVVKTQHPAAVRGRIFDSPRPVARRQHALVRHRDRSVGAGPARARGGDRRARSRLREAAEVRRRVAQARERGVREPIAVLERQSHERAAAIRQIRYRVPGLGRGRRLDPGSIPTTGSPPTCSVTSTSRRGSSCAGCRPRPTSSETSSVASVWSGATSPTCGASGGWSATWSTRAASGSRGPAGELAELIGGDPYIAPDPGHDLHLSIDLELQRAAEEAMAAKPAGGGRGGRDLDRQGPRAGLAPGVRSPTRCRAGSPLAQETELYGDPRRPFIDKTLRQH